MRFHITLTSYRYSTTTTNQKLPNEIMMRQRKPLLTLLIIDDDINAQSPIVELLKEHGYAVELCESHAKARLKLANNIISPDIIISDGDTQCEIHGYEFLELGYHRGIPTIAASESIPMNKLMEDNGACASIDSITDYDQWLQVIAEVAEGQTHRKQHVLIIEDHPPHREAIASLLQSAGFNVTTAQNHHEARDKLANGYRPDIITSDYHTYMGDQEKIDGEVFVQQGMHLGIPVIALSGVPRFNERIQSANPKDVVGCISRDLIVRYAKIQSGEFGNEINSSQLEVAEDYSHAKEILKQNAVDAWNQLVGLIQNPCDTSPEQPTQTAPLR